MGTKFVIIGPNQRLIQGIKYPLLVASAKKSVNEVLKIMEDAAKADYSKKRKTQSPSIANSMIISSFSYDTNMLGSLVVQGTLFAGGPDAPYAGFVNDGHAHRDGSSFKGYHFMEAGGKAGAKAASRIINDNIRMIR